MKPTSSFFILSKAVRTEYCPTEVTFFFVHDPIIVFYSLSCIHRGKSLLSKSIEMWTFWTPSSLIVIKQEWSQKVIIWSQTFWSIILINNLRLLRQALTVPLFLSWLLFNSCIRDQMLSKKFQISLCFFLFLTELYLFGIYWCSYIFSFLCIHFIYYKN